MTVTSGIAPSWQKSSQTLDSGATFNAMNDTPYFRDAVYEQFSAEEYARRYAALRQKMRELELDCLIVPGGPSHWSFGSGMLWLTGHWEWHSLAAYVVVPLEGEPVLVYGMGGTHIEAVRRETAIGVADVRSGQFGRYGEVMADCIRQAGLASGRIGILEIDPRHGDYLPVNQYDALRSALPEAEFIFTKGIFHELMSVHSEEELDCIRVAGSLCQRAMEALVQRAVPGQTEQQLRAAAASAILEGGGDIDFLIIGSTPMSAPSLIFGNPRPSGRVLCAGDLIVMELAAGYRGYTAQIGSPVCIGQPPRQVRQFWDDIVLPGYQKMTEKVGPGSPLEALREAGEFFRQKGAQSRPIHVHGIDLVSSGPHIFADHVAAEPYEKVMRPGMVLVVEPTPITSDGMMGMFLGHTFIVTNEGRECVDNFPLELVVAG